MAIEKKIQEKLENFWLQFVGRTVRFESLTPIGSVNETKKQEAQGPLRSAWPFPR